MDALDTDDSLAWRPSEQVKQTANWTAFIAQCGLPDYPSLAARAESYPEWFWNALIRYVDYRFYQPYERVLDVSAGVEFARWCVGGTTNLVLNALDRKSPEQRANRALVWESEDGAVRRWSYGELDAETCRIAAGLISLGLRKGDVIGLYMPPLPETVAAVFAIAKLGCIALPLFSGFGPEALATRLNDGAAVAVITADGTMRRGQPMAMKTVLDAAIPLVSTLRHVVVVRCLETDLSMTAGRDHWWHELTAGQPVAFPTAELDAEHPLMVIYTSGTTGKPKGIVHTHCGLPIKAAQDTQLCWDFQPEDRIFSMVDFGWIAGAFAAIGSALAGATLVMAEGVPDYPKPDRYWRLIQDHRVTVVGLAPTLARGLRRHGDEGVDRHDLSSLRIVTVSGEPCDNDTWMWIYRHVSRGVAPILNLSGGTEIGCGILASNLLYPIKPGSFSGPVPGTGADIVDLDGRRVGPGETGELVMRQPSIGLTRGFWHDRERYLDAYWRQLPGIWVHGDLAMRDADGYWYVHGRSDDTIKVSGKRTGPAEIEDMLLATHAVSEVAIVGVPDSITGSAVVAVVIPAPGETAGLALARRLSTAIVAGLGSSFRPRHIMFVNDFPRTRNMKIMRRVVRAVLTGQPPGDLSSLLNPEAIDELQQVLERSLAADKPD